MKKVLLVFGTRPEAIKMAPLIKEFKRHPSNFETLVCVTGQHREMLDQVLSIFEIKPDFDLNLMQQGQDLFDISSRVMLGLRNVLTSTAPDIVLVHGDTSTSFAASLSAFYLKIPVAHIEAGLRTYNKYSPWPEEVNRQLTSRIASYHFAPTTASAQNLFNEGIDRRNVFVVGNTVIDALLLSLKRIKEEHGLSDHIITDLASKGLPNELCGQWAKNERSLCLITGHRRENFGQGMINICEAIKELSQKYSQVDFVYPMHRNPNVREAIDSVFGIEHLNTNLYFIEPLEYLSFVYMMSISHIVLTDSGGIQEEAPGLKKPVLVMRDTTERGEAVAAGTVKLVGQDKHLIIQEFSKLMDDEKEYELMANASNPYGEGQSSREIVKVLMGL